MQADSGFLEVEAKRPAYLKVPLLCQLNMLYQQANNAIKSIILVIKWCQSISQLQSHLVLIHSAHSISVPAKQLAVCLPPTYNRWLGVENQSRHRNWSQPVAKPFMDIFARCLSRWQGVDENLLFNGEGARLLLGFLVEVIRWKNQMEANLYLPKAGCQMCKASRGLRAPWRPQ